MRALVAASLLLAPLPVLAFDVDGVALGASEVEIRSTFPSAYCKPLEWKSPAADRRCDDALISFVGVDARVTFFLRGDAVQGFNVRFATKEQPRVVAALKSRWGPPTAETRDVIPRKERSADEVYKMTWDKADEHAMLIWRPEHKRCSLMVSRGDFAEEIYRVR